MTSPRKGGPDDGGDDPLLEGPAYSTRTGPDDRAYAEMLAGKLTTVPPEGAIEWGDDIVRVPVVGIAIEGELAHAHFATDDSESEAPKTKLVYDVVAVPAVAPMVATVTSMTFHGAPLVPGIGSVDVLAAGLAVFRVGIDAVLCPAATPLPHGGGVVVPMGPPPTVFVNGFPIARAGDAVMEVLGGPNPIMLGAPTVLAGPPAPPSMSISPIGRPAGDDRSALERGLDWLDAQVELDVHARADVHVGEGSGKLTGGLAGSFEDRVGGPEGKLEGEGSLVRVDGEVVVELSVFGWSVDVVDHSFERTVGKWKGHGDVIFDPVQRRPGASGDFDISLFGDDE